MVTKKQLVKEINKNLVFSSPLSIKDRKRMMRFKKPKLERLSRHLKRRNKTFF